jgi:hypothetical protein
MADNKEGFLEGMVDEAAKFPGQVMEAIAEGVFEALAAPFRSSSDTGTSSRDHGDRDSRSGGGCTCSWFCRCR